ncbi:PepSY domain-containing protein [Candidatus Nitrospira salsa]
MRTEQHNPGTQPNRSFLTWAIALTLMTWAIVLTVGVGWSVLPAHAEDDLLPYDQIKTELAPIQQLFTRINQEFEGIILEIELEEEDASWIYEVKLLTPRGNVLEVEYDAKSLDLLNVNGRRDSLNPY